MTISIIVAVAKNGVIGGDNTLLWRLSEDLKLFRTRTTGHAIIMGRKTFDSIGKALPNRLNIVISRSTSLEIPGCHVVSSMKKAIEVAQEHDLAEEIFIIGGEKIYKLAEEYTTKLYLTQVDLSPEGDAYFDFSVYNNWKETNRQDFFKSEVNEAAFSVITYEK